MLVRSLKMGSMLLNDFSEKEFPRCKECQRLYTSKGEVCVSCEEYNARIKKQALECESEGQYEA